MQSGSFLGRGICCFLSFWFPYRVGKIGQTDLYEQPAEDPFAESSLKRSEYRNQNCTYDASDNPDPLAFLKTGASASPG